MEQLLFFLTINLKTGDKKEYKTNRTQWKNLIVDNGVTAWGVYAPIWNYGRTVQGEISSLRFVEGNVLWSSHYAQRFGYIVESEVKDVD